MADTPDYAERQPFRRIFKESRLFRLPEGLPAIPLLPGSKRRELVPGTLTVTYDADWCPARSGGDTRTWTLWRMDLHGEGGGRVFWAYHELREACPEAADIVAADAATYLTEKNGSAPRWLMPPTTTDGPPPCPPPRAPSGRTTTSSPT